MRINSGYFTKVLLISMVVFSSIQSVLAAPIELSMGDCIALALKNNPTLKIAEAGKEKNRWAIKQSEASKGFTLSFDHTDSHYNTAPNPSDFIYDYTYYTDFDNELSLGLTLYSGGKLEGQIDQAKLNFKIGDLNLDATKQQLKLSAVSAYFDVLQYQKILEVNQESMDDLDAHLAKVQAQYGAGMVPKADFLYSQVQLSSTQDGLIRVRNNYENAVENLSTVIGLPMNSEVKLKDDFHYEKYALTMDDCVQYTLKNRPEMAEYQASISVAKDNLTIAQSGYLPTVTFKGTRDWDDQTLPGQTSRTWQVSLTASLNVLDAGLTASQLKQAKYGLETAQQQARQNQDSIVLEVRQAYHSLREAENRIETAEVSVEHAEEDYKISEIGYSSGVTDNLNVIDAELALAQAKTLYIQALYDYNTSKVKLDKAMGVTVK